MKYIFDFDDVLFYNTSQFKERMFELIAATGVPEIEARNYYSKPEVRSKEFSLRTFITTLFDIHGIDTNVTSVDGVYQDIMSESPNYVNRELIDVIIKKFGIENCYIVTNGETEFNTDKLTYSDIWSLFGEDRIIIVPDSKKSAIAKICSEQTEGEKVVFIDDKETFMDDLGDIPNLFPIIYEFQNVNELMKEIERATTEQSPASKLKKRC